MEMSKIIGLCIIFVLMSSPGFATPPTPAGVDGAVFEPDGITEVPEGTLFSICNLNNSYCLNGTTGSYTHSGRYSAAIKGEEGDLVEMTAWNQYHNTSRRVLLNGSLHGVNLLLNTSLPDYPPVSASSPSAAEHSSFNDSLEQEILSNFNLENLALPAIKSTTLNGIKVSGDSDFLLLGSRPASVKSMATATVAYLRLAEGLFNLELDEELLRGGIPLGIYHYTGTWRLVEELPEVTKFKAPATGLYAIGFIGEKMKPGFEEYSFNPPPKVVNYITLKGRVYKNKLWEASAGTKFVLTNLNTGAEVTGETGMVSPGSFIAIIEGHPGDELGLAIDGKEFRFIAQAEQVVFNPVLGGIISFEMIIMAVSIIGIMIARWRRKRY